MLVQRVVAEAEALRLDLLHAADRDQQPLEIVVGAGDLCEFRDHHFGRRQEQGPDQSELRDHPPAAEKQDDGDRADDGGGAAPRRAVLLHRLPPRAA